MPYFNMVGLLSSEVKEARERVRTALKNSGESIPTYRVTINLSPADRRKEGAGFDLPIALSLLCAMGRIDANKADKILIMGELGLDGEIKRVNGILPIINMAKAQGYEKCIIPRGNSNEGQLIEGIEVLAFTNLKEVIEYFDGRCNEHERWNVYKKLDASENNYNEENFSDISGQESVKRAIIIAAAGWHNMMMIGPPGVGKSMLAYRIPGIMSEMSDAERTEVSNIHSICGLLGEEGYVKKRPYSAPHHTITSSALIGGGREPRPGELTIAHRGILFLDELPEFHPAVLDALRQPLEDKVVKIHRMSGNYVFPADCLIIAAMNPCRCGYYPDRSKCNCSEAEITGYLRRVSGPIIDRMDMSVEVPRVKVEEIGNIHNNMDSGIMKNIVKTSIERQRRRQGLKYNSQLSVDEIRRYCRLGKEESQFINDAYTRFELSMRGYYKVIKIARTIADIDGSDSIDINHLAEALAYRMSDRGFFHG